MLKTKAAELGEMSRSTFRNEEKLLLRPLFNLKVSEYPTLFHHEGNVMESYVSTINELIRMHKFVQNVALVVLCTESTVADHRLVSGRK